MTDENPIPVLLRGDHERPERAAPNTSLAWSALLITGLTGANIIAIFWLIHTAVGSASALLTLVGVPLSIALLIGAGWRGGWPQLAASLAGVLLITTPAVGLLALLLSR